MHTSYLITLCVRSQVSNLYLPGVSCRRDRRCSRHHLRRFEAFLLRRLAGEAFLLAPSLQPSSTGRRAKTSFAAQSRLGAKPRVALSLRGTQDIRANGSDGAASPVSQALGRYLPGVPFPPPRQMESASCAEAIRTNR